MPRCLLITRIIRTIAVGAMTWLACPSHAFPPYLILRIRAADAAHAATQPADQTQPEDRAHDEPREIFPHIRLDRTSRSVEFDGQIAIHAHAQDGSVVFLEVVACRPDTKEHEALVVSSALASHLHAALLLLGAEAGRTGGWEWQGQTLHARDATGTPLSVTIAWTDEQGIEHQHAATDLIVNRADGRTFTDSLVVSPAGDSDAPPPHFVFAGSRFVTHQGAEFYDADGTGLLVGLHTFGSETIALGRTISPEAEVEEPEWIARRDLLPVRGTPVVVRIRIAE